MKMLLEIDLDNAAFESSGQLEVARILRKLAHDIEFGGQLSPNSIGLFDINGNKCGVCRVGHFPTEPIPPGFKG